MKRSSKAEFVADDEVTRAQIGAMCWRLHRGKVEVLLVTSRDTGRWVIPKGWPIDGLSAAQAAEQEAWEEAGVKGSIEADAIGVYSYDKRRLPQPPLPCSVTVFPLRVTRLADKFPERAERQRKWFSARKAARLVDEPELRALFTHFDTHPDLLGTPEQMPGKA